MNAIDRQRLEHIHFHNGRVGRREGKTFAQCVYAIQALEFERIIMFAVPQESYIQHCIAYFETIIQDEQYNDYSIVSWNRLGSVLILSIGTGCGVLHRRIKFITTSQIRRGKISSYNCAIAHDIDYLHQQEMTTDQLEHIYRHFGTDPPAIKNP